MEELQPLQPIIEQSESIKLIKNTKGYNWEIKLIKIDMKRLNRLNIQMIKDYGVKKK